MSSQESQPSEAATQGPSVEAFPATVDPPWRRRKNLLVTVCVPSTLVGAGIVTLILVLRASGSPRDEHTDRSSEVLQDPTTNPAKAGGTDTDDERQPGPGDVAELRDGDEIWGEEDLDEGEVGAGHDASPGDAEITEEDEVTEELDEELERRDTSGGNIVFEGKIGAGSTVVRKLTSHGLTNTEANEVVTALDGLFDFRQSQPGHRYVLELGGAERAVQRFRYVAGPTDVFEVSPQGGRLKGRRVKVKTTLRRIRAGKRITGSLAEAITGAGLDQRVVRVFLRTFGSDINFQNDQRPGDSLKVIADEEYIEGKRLGYKSIWAMEFSGQVVGRRRAFFFEASGEKGRYYNERGESLEQNRLRTPCNYNRISSPFDPNRLHPILKRRVPHHGVDFAAARGTPVWATADGTTTFVGKKGASGNLVILRHAGNLESIYAHLHRFARGLKRGQDVDQGQLIGTVGSTGRSTGPHLHFGLRKGGRFIDPVKYRSGPHRVVDPRFKTQFASQARRLAQELDAIRIR